MATDKKKDEQDNVPDTVPVYNINDGISGRNGGPYLDEEMAKEQERRNALREGREPDFSDLTAAPYSGIQLVTADQLLTAHRTAGSGFTGADGITAPEYGTIPNPVKVEQERIERETKATEEAAAKNPDNTEPVPDRSGPPEEVQATAAEGAKSTSEKVAEPAPTKAAAKPRARAKPSAKPAESANSEK